MGNLRLALLPRIVAGGKIWGNKCLSVEAKLEVLLAGSVLRLQVVRAAPVAKLQVYL